MAQLIDIRLKQGADGIFDIDLDDDGQLVLDFGFETTIALSIFGERRASDGEVSDPQFRRGWIGNLLADVPGFEQGSKSWLFKQARLNSATTSGIRNTHQDSLQWMIDDGLANTVTVTNRQNGSSIPEEISIDGNSSFFDAWNNTTV